jgi:hypothetical protein
MPQAPPVFAEQSVEKQAPAWHTSSAPQAFPQAPQFWGSELVLVQLEPQHSVVSVIPSPVAQGRSGVAGPQLEATQANRDPLITVHTVPCGHEAGHPPSTPPSLRHSDC